MRNNCSKEHYLSNTMRTATQLEIGRHLDETELEQYSMGTLPEPQLPPFEEHFLACESCQDRLLEMETYVNAVRSVSPKLRETPRSRWVELFAWPRPVWVAAAAMVAVALLVGRNWTPLPVRGPEIAIVLLQASRGIEGLTSAKALARQPLSLQIDLTEIPGYASYRLEIVDSRGRPESVSVVTPRNGKIVQPLIAGLPAGRYYVRLYTPGGELLREFGLQVG